MTTKWRISPEKLMDKVELERVSKVRTLLKLDGGTAIDSYDMSPNGPTLSSVFLVSGGYFCEIKMNDKHLSFDFGRAVNVINYRISFGEHVMQGEAPVTPAESTTPTAADIEKPAPVSAKLIKFVVIDLRHTDILTSRMSYFGDDVDAWLEFVLDAYPKNLLIGA